MTLLKEAGVLRSAAHQAFHGRDQHAQDGVGDEAVMNPEPGKPDHLENVAQGDTIARGGNLAHRENLSHGAVCTAARGWDQ